MPHGYPLPHGYQEFPAHWPVGHPVEADWSYLAAADGLHRVLPDGRIDLIAHFRLAADDTVSGLQLLIAGPSTGHFMVPVTAGLGFIGLRFRAGWGGACLGLDPATVRDTNLDDAQVQALLGERLAPVRSAKDLATLHTALRSLATELASAAGSSAHPQAQAAIDLLHVSGGRLPVVALAEQVGCSERHLRRTMRQAVGLPVKTLAAILRFQRTARLLRADPTLSLSAAACEGGYSDQAHMARDFRRLGGFSPSDRAQVTHGDLPL
ncbi:helix-turn-helix domain-containing protein [Chitinimonas sp.]|uniref:AraC family transcriptional regulator n=1 Tax=Chitinimonas sp. TaxID=1934313 RepID=UPI002F92BD55